MNCPVCGGKVKDNPMLGGKYCEDCGYHVY